MLLSVLLIDLIMPLWISNIFFFKFSIMIGFHNHYMAVIAFFASLGLPLSFRHLCFVLFSHVRARARALSHTLLNMLFSGFAVQCIVWYPFSQPATISVDADVETSYKR